MPLQQLTQGTEVHITTHPESGIVKGSTESPRQYEVETPTGVIKRSRVQLVPLPAADPITTDGVSKKFSATPELNILSRSKRTLKLSLKARESKGLA